MEINVFSFDADINYIREYIPKRCRKARAMEMYASHSFHVKQISKEQVPVAFKVENFTIRLFNGKLYGSSSPSLQWSNGKEYKSLPLKRQLAQFATDMSKLITRNNPKDMNAWVTTEYIDRPYDMLTSKDVYETLDETCEKVQSNIDRNLIMIDGELWETTAEPRYNITTFGLGHNHGGTGIFVEYGYNPNISKNNYFRADQAKEAYEYAIKVAERRGDTKDVARFKEALKSKKLFTYIEVCIPEAVKCNPQKEAGDGNPLLNRMEDIIEASPDKVTAGLGVMLSTLDQKD